eukprot:241385-Pleurochrysis_carterae.AAC.3
MKAPKASTQQATPDSTAGANVLTAQSPIKVGIRSRRVHCKNTKSLAKPARCGKKHVCCACANDDEIA